LPVLRAVIDACEPARIAVLGDVTDAALTEWAAAAGAAVVPMVAGDADPARVPDAECFVVDAPANHWETEALLAAVLPAATRLDAVVVVRHVAWPAGDRDHYPCPARLPEGVAHPYTTAFGLRPGTADPVVDGLRGAAGSAWAIAGGGSGNGVRSAVEAALARYREYVLAVVPVAFGIAVAWPSTARYSAVLEARVAPWSDDLVQTLVATQLDLLDRLLEASARAHERGDAGPRLRGENARLRARVAELEGALDDVVAALDTLSYSAVLRAVDVAERPARRNRPGRTFRGRLLAVRDRAARAGDDA